MCTCFKSVVSARGLEATDVRLSHVRNPLLLALTPPPYMSILVRSKVMTEASLELMNLCASWLRRVQYY